MYLKTKTVLKKSFFWPTLSKHIIGRIKRNCYITSTKRGIKDYESMFKDKLLSALKTSESKNKTRNEKITEEIKKLQRMFSKSEIKEIKRNLYEIENKRNLSASKKYLLKLEERLSRLKTYYDHDDAEYKGIKDIQDLFDLSTGEDYYRPTIVNGTFNNNYIQQESKEDKDKILTVNEYLDIRPYLVDKINGQ